VPAYAVLLRELQRTQGFLAFSLKLFREQLGSESAQLSRSARDRADTHTMGPRAGT
jgi:hypothetical protein